MNNNNNNNLKKEEKLILKMEFNKDLLIQKLMSKVKKGYRIIIFIAIVFIISISYIYYLKSQLFILKTQLTQNYFLLSSFQINSIKKREKYLMEITTKVCLHYNPNLTEKQIYEIYEMCYNIGEQKYNIPLEIWLVLIATESDFKVKAVSDAGAIGLLQVMPATGRYICSKFDIDWIGEKTLYDIKNNLLIGMYYFKDCLISFDYDLLKSIVAYNFGIPAVKNIDIYQHKRNPIVRKRMLSYYRRFLEQKMRIEKIIGYNINLDQFYFKK